MDKELLGGVCSFIFAGLRRRAQVAALGSLGSAQRRPIRQRRAVFRFAPRRRASRPFIYYYWLQSSPSETTSLGDHTTNDERQRRGVPKFETLLSFPRPPKSKAPNETNKTMSSAPVRVAYADNFGADGASIVKVRGRGGARLTIKSISISKKQSKGNAASLL